MGKAKKAKLSGKSTVAAAAGGGGGGVSLADQINQGEFAEPTGTLKLGELNCVTPFYSSSSVMKLSGYFRNLNLFPLHRPFPM